MGYTRYFYTDEDEPKQMTLDEVMAGVQAIRIVAERRKDEFRIDHLTDTKILINVRSDNPVESFAFMPTAIGKGLFVQEFGSCKTNQCPEDEGIKEMLDVLQAAVNNKLRISD